jgi:hypothetical protein
MLESETPSMGIGFSSRDAKILIPTQDREILETVTPTEYLSDPQRELDLAFASIFETAYVQDSGSDDLKSLFDHSLAKRLEAIEQSILGSKVRMLEGGAIRLSTAEMLEGEFLGPLLIGPLQKLERHFGLMSQTTAKTYRTFIRTTFFEETHRQIVSVRSSDLNAHKRAAVSWEFINEWRFVRGFLEACVGNGVPACFQWGVNEILPMSAEDPDDFDDVPDPLRLLYRKIIHISIPELEMVPEVENWKSVGFVRGLSVTVEMRTILSQLLASLQTGDLAEMHSCRTGLRSVAGRLKDVMPVRRVGGLRIHASLPIAIIDALLAENTEVTCLSPYVSGYSGTIATRRNWVALSLRA